MPADPHSSPSPPIKPKVFRHAGFRWEALDEAEQIIRSRDDWRAESLRRDLPDAIIHSRNDERFVFRTQLAGHEVAIKVQLAPDYKPKLRSIYGRCKSRKEWEHHLVAVRHGFPTVAPLALGEFRNPLAVHEAIFITRWQHNITTLLDWRRARADRTGDADALWLATEFGRLAARTHQHGIYHEQMHGGNILIHESNGDRTLMAVDWTHARLRRHSVARDAQYLIRTDWFLQNGIYSLAPAVPTDTEKRTFLDAYLRATPDPRTQARLLARLRSACPHSSWLPTEPPTTKE